MNLKDKIQRLEIIWEEADSDEYSNEELILMAEICTELKLDWRSDTSNLQDGWKMLKAIQNRPTVMTNC